MRKALVAALLAGLALAPAASAQPTKGKRNVAIVVHERVELLDFAGPGEVFAAAARGQAFNVYTVAETTQPVVSQGFLRITPQYSIADCPRPDIVVIPGGYTGLLLKSPKFMTWVRTVAKDAEIMMSVCTGAFVLAETGLLDGKEATTHYASIKGLQRDYPKIKVCADRRVVDNGKVVTTAGVSAGIDGALHVVARLCGSEVAQRTARYMEYKWEPESNLKTEPAPKSAAQEAAEHWFLGRWKEAAAAYQGHLATHPEDGVAWYRLGTSQLFARQNPEALASLEKAVSLGQRNGEALSFLGLAQVRAKRPEEAVKSLEQALAAGRRDPDVFHSLACAHALGGQKDKALAALERLFAAGLGDTSGLLTEPLLGSLREEPGFRDLIRRNTWRSTARLTTADEPGQPLVVTGTVRDAAGNPVEGALLYVYHTDAKGYYTASKAAGAPNARLFGYVRTGRDGRFEFRTIRPGGYPDDPANPAKGVPEHVHFEVSAPGFPTRSLELLFADDPRMTAETREFAKKAGSPVAAVTRDEDGMQRCACDIVLQRGEALSRP